MTGPTLFDSILDVPTEGAHHATDPDTSVESARGQVEKVGPQAKRCLLALASAPNGLTDDELFAAVRGITPKPITERYIAGTRRGLLRDLGLVERTEAKRPSAKGKPAYVWRVTSDGLRVALDMRKDAA